MGWQKLVTSGRVIQILEQGLSVNLKGTFNVIESELYPYPVTIDINNMIFGSHIRTLMGELQQALHSKPEAVP